MVKNLLFDVFTNEFLDRRQAHSCTTSLKGETVSYLNEAIDFLFPHFSKKIYLDANDVFANMNILKRNLAELVKQLNGNSPDNPNEIADSFIKKIPEIHSNLWRDAEAIHAGDPASESVDEVILAYPGFMAIVIYRLSHELYLLKVPIIPRIMSEHAHQITGIDIHPGAQIGNPFFIDHGTGIVIGETTIIGKNVKIYQGVTLGALSVEKTLSQTKRHPTIEDDVIIYSQAVILGGNTIVGRNSVIGGNSWVTQSIPADSVVYNKSEVRIKTNKDFEEPINFII
jgi:serine O-acetyltransferase